MKIQTGGRQDTRTYDSKVRKIHIGTVAVERFAVTWDGRDADGGLVAPGVYLATLRADDGFEATAKVTLAP